MWERTLTLREVGMKVILRDNSAVILRCPPKAGLEGWKQARCVLPSFEARAAEVPRSHLRMTAELFVGLLQSRRDVLVLARELHAGEQRHGLGERGEILLQIFVRA